MAIKKAQPKPSEIVVTVDPNAGTSRITVVADRPEDRDEALDALRLMLPNIELLESSAKPVAVLIQFDDDGSFFAGHDALGVKAVRFQAQARAIDVETAREVVKRLRAKGHKVSVFRNTTKEASIGIESVWK